MLAYKFFDVPGTPLMVIRSNQSATDVAVKHSWMDIEDISPELQKAVICAEDQLFLEHGGFDIAAIKKAQEENKKGKRQILRSFSEKAVRKQTNRAHARVNGI